MKDKEIKVTKNVPEGKAPKKAPEIQAEVSKLKPKSIRTVEQIKIAFQQLEALEVLIGEINRGDVDFYTKQNKKISALPVRLTAISSDIKTKTFDYLKKQLQLKKEELSKIITGE